jgi:hypothetical protein
MMEEGEEVGEGVVLASETRLTRNQRRLAGTNITFGCHDILKFRFSITRKSSFCSIETVAL